MSVSQSLSEPSGATRRTQEPSTTSQSFRQEPIAIVGLACRLPGGVSSPRTLWELLERGGIASTDVPKDRFNVKGHYDGSKKPGTMRPPGGMFLEDVDLKTFDAPFFEISRAEAVSMDPNQRQLLEVVYEGLENAGLPLHAIDSKPVGCFVASYASDYHDMQSRDPIDRPPSIEVGIGRSILSNRISHFLNIKGPSVTVDTACSGSLVGLDMACRYLQTGEVEAAIVAASNLYLSPEHVMDTGPIGQAHSPTGRCHTFDAKADGYIKAEAVNAIILKRLDDAIRDRDPIRAVIRGSATNSDGRTPGIASPNSAAQAAATRAAYTNAGLTGFAETSYLECHGTGTPAGDPLEVNGVSSVFASSRPANSPLVIGSIKSNIGHSEAAAGLSGLLKATLAIEHGVIPGNPTFLTPNPKIDFKALCVTATRSSIPWPKSAFRRASINSFGYGGTNSHVILDEVKSLHPHFTPFHVSSFLTPEDDIYDEEESSRPYTLLFSANDSKSLQAYTEALDRHTSNLDVRVKLRDLAYTLSERRSHHFHRGYIVARGSEIDAKSLVQGKKTDEQPRIGFVFTGQGAQWAQMGKGVIDIFPNDAKPILTRLDRVLQSLPTPPDWSLLRELTESRTSEHLRLPEFSQPLVTALQLVLVQVLRRWNIEPECVVGHSSGEIAAAYTAGYLSEEDAIKTAFYRGQSAKNCRRDGQSAVGMLAVGLGPDVVSSYLEGVEGEVQIACYNSPGSVTLSGIVPRLEEVKGKLVADGHFARLLLVDLAYHSKFMAEIGKDYEQLLNDEVTFADSGNGHVKMFSSVSGQQLDRPTDALYWKSNMVSPVRFSEACREMFSGREGANFVIEIGPSGALAGPVSQIKDAMGAEGRNITYAAGLTRGLDSVVSLFALAGKLFVAGAPVNFAEVNNEQSDTEENQAPPSIIVDLPNYVWNHTNQYWHESQASKDWRFREFPEHDLLGSKVLASPWESPSFRKTLFLDRVPWLRDHNMGGDIIFPASGYISMAIEAIFQKTTKQRLQPAGASSTSLQYRLRNVKFDKALVLEEGSFANILLNMNPLVGTQDTWHEFQISSANGETSLVHCTGLVRLDTSPAPVPSSDDLSPLVHPTPAHLWYKAQSEVGYGFGPSFQRTLMTETLAGQRRSRCTTLLEEPQSAHSPQSPYPMHPACIDGCFQTVTPSLWSGERPSLNAVLVPATVDDLVIYPKVDSAKEGLSVATSNYNGRGRVEESKNFHSNCTVFDPETSLPLLKMQGLHYHKLDTGKDVHQKHTYNRTVWRPDITFLSQDELHALAQKTEHGDLQAFIDLVAHKRPSVKVLEVSCIAGDSGSLWFSAGDPALRGGYEQYSYISSDAKALLTAKEALQVFRATSFDLVDISKNVSLPGTDYDFVIVKVSRLDHDAASNIARSIRPNLAAGAILLVLEVPPDSLPLTSDSSSDSDNGSGSSVVLVSDPNSPTFSEDDGSIDSALMSAGFDNLLRLPQEWAPNAYFATVSDEFVDDLNLQEVNIVHLTGRRRLSDGLKNVLRQGNWKVTEHVYPHIQIQPKSIVLVLEESTSPLLKSISERQWETVKSITLQGCHLLWVTEGSQMSITHPDNALVHGMFRTIRAEDRAADLVTLDVEYGQGPSAHLAIERLLRRFTTPRNKTLIDSEFVERGSILHISRVTPDVLVNTAKDNEDIGGPPVTRELREVEGIAKLQTERIGTLDSLFYSQQSIEDEPMLDFHIEVDIKAAGLNFKDVAVTMGIVPENEYLLGLEGAGIVRRVGKGSKGFSVGDRVAILKNGTFANRIQCPIERAHRIPEAMSFVDAATIPLVYLTSLYSLFDIGGLKKGQSVLIHSAAGGVGLSAIQLAQWAGAEIFVTVGTQEKRDFLHENYGIPYDRMFSSRTTAFGAEILAATENKGIDVILNSLTGELLDESWRICADGGHMVEIGKKDIVSKNFLSMEPFDRNCSYRGVDFSYSKQIKDTLIQDLLKRTFKLVNEGHLKPIHPLTVYSFSDIPSSFAYMRTGRHIGKIVIADDEGSTVAVPIRPPRRTVKLDPDTSYAIVGGLKGLCGSLAIYLAKNGAKNIVAMSRSGCSDDRSQNIISNCRSLGCTVEDAKVDVTDFVQVKSALQKAKYPVGGIIQGAMVLRDKPYEMMTVNDFHTTLSNKVDGTWNLHNASLELKRPLKFFTLLSSISGVIGQKGQANYAAANVFLDAFAIYRISRGLPANSVNLGVIEDVGYVAEQGGMQAHFDDKQWIGINERVLHKILGLSILQQTDTINPNSASQLITGVPVPQPADSDLIYDARFAALFRPDSDGENNVSASQSAEKDVQALVLLRSSGADASTLVGGAVAAVGAKFERTLRLSDPVEPAKSLSAYGLDSLSAVELRNWIRTEIGVEVTVLEITNASSLTSLCEKIVGKMLA